MPFFAFVLRISSFFRYSSFVIRHFPHRPLINVCIHCGPRSPTSRTINSPEWTEWSLDGAACSFIRRKVRAPQDAVVGNAHRP